MSCSARNRIPLREVSIVSISSKLEHMAQGRFIVFEGVDGGGKSTQLKLLADRLRASGRQVVTCRDPGGTTMGESIRGLLLDPASVCQARCEMLLYMASRAELVDQIIRPAIEQDHDVLCDRFYLSTICYQGYGGGLANDDIRSVAKIATGGLDPHLTLVLDLDPQTAQHRLSQSRPKDRIEQRSAEYFSKVRAGFQQEVTLDPKHLKLIAAGADTTIEQVHAQIWNELQTWR